MMYYTLKTPHMAFTPIGNGVSGRGNYALRNLELEVCFQGFRLPGPSARACARDTQGRTVRTGAQHGSEADPEAARPATAGAPKYLKR